MKMPSALDPSLFAPCGVNCGVCYKHVDIRKTGRPCDGCLKGDSGKTARCLQCKIKACAQAKDCLYCFACVEFPCKAIKSMDQSYTKRYHTSLIKNSQTAKALGIPAFLKQDRERWTCQKCGGAFSLHDHACSECGLLEDE